MLVVCKKEILEREAWEADYNIKARDFSLFVQEQSQRKILGLPQFDCRPNLLFS